MLVVTVQLVPGGFLLMRRTVAFMSISNISSLADVSDYRVEAIEEANPLTGASRRNAECLVPAHARNQSVWTLLGRACAEVVKPEFTTP